jgi:hypothetical protein
MCLPCLLPCLSLPCPQWGCATTRGRRATAGAASAPSMPSGCGRFSTSRQGSRAAPGATSRWVECLVDGQCGAGVGTQPRPPPGASTRPWQWSSPNPLRILHSPSCSPTHPPTLFFLRSCCLPSRAGQVQEPAPHERQLKKRVWGGHRGVGARGPHLHQLRVWGLTE